MEAAATRPRRGRPPSDAPERILEAALEVMKKDGYAGLSNAKVAAASGQNKALIAYYFGSKEGLIAAVAGQVRQRVVDEVLDAIGEPRTAADLVQGLVDGVWRVMDRDEGLQRVYFDLASQSVIEPEARRLMTDMKEEFRTVLGNLLRQLDDGPGARNLAPAVLYLMAGVEGLALERLDRGDSAELKRARRIFIDSAAQMIRSLR